MVEHPLDVRGVKGSSPLSSTMCKMVIRELVWHNRICCLDGVFMFEEIKKIDTEAYNIIAQAKECASEIVRVTAQKKKELVQNHEEQRRQQEAFLRRSAEMEYDALAGRIQLKSEGLAVKLERSRVEHEESWVESIFKRVVKGR